MDHILYFSKTLFTLYFDVHDIPPPPCPYGGAKPPFQTSQKFRIKSFTRLYIKWKNGFLLTIVFC